MKSNLMNANDLTNAKDPDVRADRLHPAANRRASPARPDQGHFGAVVGVCPLNLLTVQLMASNGNSNVTI